MCNIIMEINNLDNIIQWIKINKKNEMINKINKKKISNKILYFNDLEEIITFDNKNNNYSCRIDYQIDKEDLNLILNSDDCKIEFVKNNFMILNSSKPDYIIMGLYELFRIRLEDLKAIPFSIFYKSINLFSIIINELLKTKSYGLIISRFTGSDTNYFEYSTYLLLNVVYDDDEKFDLLVRYVLLFESELDKDKIIELDNYIKSKSYGEYYFMHKFLLKTPEFVIKNIININKISDYNYKIRINEKIYIVKYITNNIIDKKRKLYDNFSQMTLLSKWYIYDILNEFEKNIESFYLDKISNLYYQVKYNNSLDNELYIVNLVQKHIFFEEQSDKSEIINYIFINKQIKLNYENWINLYFDGNINNYIQG